MPSRNRLFVRGKVDVLALFGVLFLTASLFTITTTVSDPVKKQLIDSFAAKGRGGGGAAERASQKSQNAQNAADSKIKRAERETKGGCDGAQCVASQVVKNSSGTTGVDKPSAQQIAEQRIIDNYVNAAASGDQGAQEFLKEERPDLYQQAAAKAIQNTAKDAAATAQERRLLQLDAKEAEDRISIAVSKTEITGALRDLKSLAEMGVISADKFYEVAAAATRKSEDLDIINNKDRFVKEAIEAQNQLNVTTDKAQREKLLNELATYARLEIISDKQYSNIVQQSDVRYAQSNQVLNSLKDATTPDEISSAMAKIDILTADGFIDPDVYQQLDQMYISQADYEKCVASGSPSECGGYLENIGKLEYSINPEMLLLTAVNESGNRAGEDALSRLKELSPDLVKLAEDMKEERMRDQFIQAADLQRAGDYTTKATPKRFTIEDINRRTCALDKDCYAELYQSKLTQTGEFTQGLNNVLNLISLGTRQEFSRMSELYGPGSTQAQGEAIKAYAIGGVELLGAVAAAEFALTPLGAKGLAILNLADDVSTVAACTAGDQNSCQMAAMTIANPIPGASMADDVIDVANAFSRSGSKAAADIAETIAENTPSSNTTSEIADVISSPGERLRAILNGDTDPININNLDGRPSQLEAASSALSPGERLRVIVNADSDPLNIRNLDGRPSQLDLVNSAPSPGERLRAIVNADSDPANLHNLEGFSDQADVTDTLASSNDRLNRILNANNDLENLRDLELTPGERDLVENLIGPSPAKILDTPTKPLINNATLADKEKAAKEIADSLPNDGGNPEQIIKAYKDKGIPESELTPDDINKVNKLVDERVTNSKSLPDVADTDLTEELVVAKTNTEANLNTSSANKPSLGQRIRNGLFGEPKVITIKPNSKGALTLKPGDTIITGAGTRFERKLTIPDPDSISTEVYWEVIGNGSKPQKLTKDGITVDLANDQTIQFGILSKNGGLDTNAEIDAIFGTKPGSSPQVFLSGRFSQPVITRANPETGWFQKLFSGELLKPKIPTETALAAKAVTDEPSAITQFWRKNFYSNGELFPAIRKIPENTPAKLASTSPYYIPRDEAEDALKYFEANYVDGDPRFSHFTAGLHSENIKFEYNGKTYMAKIPDRRTESYVRATVNGQTLALNKGLGKYVAPVTFLKGADGRPIGIQKFIDGSGYLFNTPDAQSAKKILMDAGVYIGDPKYNIIFSPDGPVLIDHEAVGLLSDAMEMAVKYPKEVGMFRDWFTLEEAQNFVKNNPPVLTKKPIKIEVPQGVKTFWNDKIASPLTEFRKSLSVKPPEKTYLQVSEAFEERGGATSFNIFPSTQTRVSLIEESTDSLPKVTITTRDPGIKIDGKPILGDAIEVNVGLQQKDVLEMGGKRYIFEGLSSANEPVFAEIADTQKPSFLGISLSKDPPIKPGEVFDPAYEAGQILKKPSSERALALENFKAKLDYQQRGSANIQTGLLDMIKKNPDVNPDDLRKYVDDLRIKYGLPRSVGGKIENAVEILIQKRTRAQQLLGLYRLEDERLFEAMFGRMPKGQIKITQGEVGLRISIYDPEDYDLVYNGDYSPSSVFDRGESLTSGGFFLKRDTLLPDTYGLVVIDNKTTLQSRLMGSQATFAHEEQHAINTILADAGIFEWSDYQINQIDNVWEALAESDAQKVIDATQDLAISVRQTANAEAKDEILAMLKGGMSNINAKHYLSIPKSENGLYDFYGSWIDLHKIFDRSENEIGRLAVAKVFAEELGTDAYKKMLNESFAAFDALLSKGYTRNEAIALLEGADLQTWSKLASRAPKPNLGTRILAYGQRYVVTPFTKFRDNFLGRSPDTLTGGKPVDLTNTDFNGSSISSNPEIVLGRPKEGALPPGSGLGSFNRYQEIPDQKAKLWTADSSEAIVIQKDAVDILYINGHYETGGPVVLEPGTSFRLNDKIYLVEFDGTDLKLYETARSQQRVFKGNTALDGSVVRINPDGTAEINLGFEDAKDLFIPLEDGGEIRYVAGKVVKGNDGHFYLINSYDNDFVTPLTRNTDPLNKLPKLKNGSAMNDALGEVLTSGLNTHDREIFAQALLHNGYPAEAINHDLLSDFDKRFVIAYNKLHPDQPLSLDIPDFNDGKMLRGLKAGAIMEFGLIGGYTVFVNRDIIVSFINELLEPGYYSPTLGVRVYEKDGKWFRADTGEEISENVDFSYINSTRFGRNTDIKSIFGSQHLTIDQTTFESPEWIDFEAKIRSQTASDPYNIDAITTAIFKNMIYNRGNGNIDGLPSALAYSLSYRYLQSAMANNLTICFDFAAVEQSYLAKLGIYSEVLAGHVDFGDGVSGGHALLLIVDKNGKKWVADPTNDFTMSYEDFVAEYNFTNEVIYQSIYGYINTDNSIDFKVGGGTGVMRALESGIDKIEKLRLQIFKPQKRTDTSTSAPDVSILQDNSQKYALKVTDSSGQNILNLPDQNTIRSGELTVTTSSGEKIQLSFPNSGAAIPVSDVKMIAKVIENLGGLGRYMPSIEIVESKNITGKYISDLKSIDPKTGRPYIRIVLNSSENSEEAISQALGNAIKFGKYGSSQESELKIAFDNIFILGKGGAPGNYFHYDPFKTLGATASLSLGKVISDPFESSFSDYLNSPEDLKQRSPAEFAFFDAVYKGYDPMDIQFVDMNGNRLPDLNSTVIIKDFTNSKNNEHNYLINQNWENLPGWIADHNSGYRPIVEQMSDKYDVPVSIIVGIMEKESGPYGNRESIVFGSLRATGLMQVLPGNGRPSADQLKNPKINIETGTAILKAIYDDPSLGNGNWRDTMALYNVGDWETLFSGEGIINGGFKYADDALQMAGIDPDSLKQDLDIFNPYKQNDKNQNDQQMAPYLRNFDIYMQRNYSNEPINNSGDTMLSRGCGPATAYNLLTLSGENVDISDVTSSFYWNCTKNGCATSADAVLKQFQDHGYKNAVQYGEANQIVNTNELRDYTGILVYGGTASSSTESVPHIAGFECNNGACVSIDSYFSDGKPVACEIESESSIRCGGYKYHVGPTNGTPDALFPIQTQ